MSPFPAFCSHAFGVRECASTHPPLPYGSPKGRKGVPEEAEQITSSLALNVLIFETSGARRRVCTSPGQREFFFERTFGDPYTCDEIYWRACTLLSFQVACLHSLAARTPRPSGTAWSSPTCTFMSRRKTSSEAPTNSERVHHTETLEIQHFSERDSFFENVFCQASPSIK